MVQKQTRFRGNSKLKCPFWNRESMQCCLWVPSVDIGKGVKDFCYDLLKQLKAVYHLRLAILRSVDPVHSKLIYLASEGADISDLRKPVLDWTENDNLSGIAVQTREVQFFKDIAELQEGECCFAHPYLVDPLGLKSMISIPILNTYNINQVLLILSLYPSSDNVSFNRREFIRLSVSLAVQFEEFLQDLCVRFANRVSIEVARVGSLSQQKIYDTVVNIVSQAVGAGSTGLYIEDPNGRRVELKSGIGDELGDQHSSEVDELANRCWKSNREFLTVSPQEGKVMYPRELLPYVPKVVEEAASSVFVPLRDLRGQPKGVFCCLKGGRDHSREGLAPFTYEDVAIIEAIGLAFAPRFEILMADFQRIQSMNKLAHELRVPLVAFKAVLERINRECREFSYTFRHDYFDEIQTYIDLQRRLLTRVDVVRKGPELIPLVSKETYFHKDIVAPAIRFTRPLIKRKGLDPNRVEYSGIRSIPGLFVDPALMTLVVFDLLDNSIKYSKKNKPESFKIEIIGATVPGGYEIEFRDYGIGIPKGWEERIFEPGIRTIDAHQHDPMGEGFGLWFVSEIVIRHNGRLVLKRLSNPTTFVIFLPESLKKEPP